MGLYETLGLIIVRGDKDETFLKLNLLYSYQNRRIPNSFRDTLFNRHEYIIESGELVSELFLAKITDRSEEVNRYLNKISVTPTDITQLNFQQWLGQGRQFESLNIELYGEKKKLIGECAVCALKYIIWSPIRI